MITPTLIYRYSIELYVSTECSLAELFSGSWKLIVDKYEEKYHLDCNLGELGVVS